MVEFGPAPVREQCGNCRFYFTQTPGTGECHWNPPANDGERWPIVRRSEWCGQWKHSKASDEELLLESEKK